jgi:hypothetical protein
MDINIDIYLHHGYRHPAWAWACSMDMDLQEEVGHAAWT